MTLPRFFELIANDNILHIQTWLTGQKATNIELVEQRLYDLNKPNEFWAELLNNQYGLKVNIDDGCKQKFIAVYLYKTGLALSANKSSAYQERAKECLNQAKKILVTLINCNEIDDQWAKLLLAEMYINSLGDTTQFETGFNLIRDLVYKSDFQNKIKLLTEIFNENHLNKKALLIKEFTKNNIINMEAYYLLGRIYHAQHAENNGFIDTDFPGKTKEAEADFEYETVGTALLQCTAAQGHEQTLYDMAEQLIGSTYMLDINNAQVKQGINYLFMAVQQNNIKALTLLKDLVQKKYINVEDTLNRLDHKQKIIFNKIKQENSHLNDSDILKLALLEMEAAMGSPTAISDLIQHYTDQQAYGLLHEAHTREFSLNRECTDLPKANMDKVLKYLRIGVYYNDPISAGYLAKLYLQPKSYDKQDAITIIRQGRQLGSALCCFELACCYLTGNKDYDIETDLGKATQYFEEAITINKNYYGKTAEIYAQQGDREQFLKYALHGLMLGDMSSIDALIGFIGKYPCPEEWKIAPCKGLNYTEIMELTRKLDGLTWIFNSNEARYISDKIRSIENLPQLAKISEGNEFNSDRYRP